MLRYGLPVHGKVAHRPVKKQAVRPTKKVSTRNIINRNASQSPLLKLIPEIREMIWKAAIGDRTIHIKHFSAEQLKTLRRHQTYPDATDPNGAFRHVECTATTTEKEAYMASKTQSIKVPAGEDPVYYVQSYKERHYNCYQLENGFHGTRAWINLFEQGDYLINEKDRSTMCTMLGTCRQVYEEAYRIFWLSNAFSFDDPYSLGEFVGSLTLSQKHHLTNLHICERLHGMPGTYGYDWEATLKKYGDKSVIDVLSGLRTLNLCLEQRFGNDFAFNYHISGRHWLSQLSQPWLALRPAPLANVTVIITDKQSWMQMCGLMHIRCTVQRKSEIAEEIRNDIIGEENVAKARQDLLDKKASQKKRREELKQMKQRREVHEQVWRILENENYPIVEITPTQLNEISRLHKVYGSTYDDPPKEYVRAAHLLEILGEQHLTGLPEAHSPGPLPMHSILEVPSQETGPIQQIIHHAGNNRYHPYTRPARVMDAHPAAHIPGATIAGTQAYAGNSHIMEHHTGSTTSTASVANVAFTMAELHEDGRGDRYLEENWPSQADAILHRDR